MLDDLVCQKSPNFKQLLADVSTNSKLILGVYTCVLKLFDVGIIWSVKYRINKQYMILVSSKYFYSSSLEYLLLPDRKNSFT